MQKTKAGGRKFKATLGKLEKLPLKMKRQDWGYKAGVKPPTPGISR